MRPSKIRVMFAAVSGSESTSSLHRTAGSAYDGFVAVCDGTFPEASASTICLVAVQFASKNADHVEAKSRVLYSAAVATRECASVSLSSSP